MEFSAIEILLHTDKFPFTTLKLAAHLNRP